MFLEASFHKLEMGWKHARKKNLSLFNCQLDYSRIRAIRTLSNADVRSAFVSQSESTDLTFGKDEQHNAGLDTNSNDNDDDGA